MYLDVASPTIADTIRENSNLLIIIGVVVLLIAIGVIILLGIKNKKKEIKEKEVVDDEEII